MSRRSARQGTPEFTTEQLRLERARVVRAAKEREGAIVVDEQGQRRFNLWISKGVTDSD